MCSCARRRRRSGALPSCATRRSTCKCPRRVSVPSEDEAVGDLAVDTAIEGSDGLYRAQLSRDWEIWGPNGGYLAVIALRAAGAHTTLRRPATFSCHYLGVADFDAVDLEVRTLRGSSRAASIAVSRCARIRATCPSTLRASTSRRDSTRTRPRHRGCWPSAARRWRATDWCRVPCQCGRPADSCWRAAVSRCSAAR